VALTLLLPLIWLVWLAQQELTNIYPALQALLANPSPVPEVFRSLPWLGAWLVEQQANLVNNPEDLSSVIKALLAAHTGDITTIAGGVGKNLVKVIFVIVILFFFYRDGVRIMRELRHVLEKFIGVQVHGYLQAVGATMRAVSMAFY
jgi:predicted PurR-regulated permease PerM